MLNIIGQKCEGTSNQKNVKMGNLGEQDKQVRVVDKARLYQIVYFEIAGLCNAKCEFCATGNLNHPKGGFVDIEKFDRSLSRLTEYGLANNKTVFRLYNWGEPTLHPELNRIIHIIQDKYGFSYKLSTNAGLPIEYHSNWFKKLSRLTISMSGFSQKSYNKIHQLDFEQVKSNIVSIVNAAKVSGYDTKRIDVAHHIYQFNFHEIPMLREWAKNLDISYYPYFAYINDPVTLRHYVNNTLSMEKMKSISDSIFCYYMNQRFQSHPKNDCRLFDSLTIDEECNIVTCVGIERDHPDSVITNIFDDNFYEKLVSWQPQSVCANCIASGCSPVWEILDSSAFPVQFDTPTSKDLYHRNKII